MTLKQARDAKGWTQVELAAKSRVRQPHISQIERGYITDPGNSTVQALEKALGVRRGSLVFAASRTPRAYARSRQSEAMAS